MTLVMAIDLSCQGHSLIRTPNRDRIAAEGQRWTTFYASSPLRNPCRIALTDWTVAHLDSRMRFQQVG